MNKIIKKILIHLVSIFQPFIYIILFGEVGIRLYTDNIDRTFWAFLIGGWLLLYFKHVIYYNMTLKEVIGE